MKFKLDNRGVSLALTIGLMLLLVAMTAAINELVIRALRSAHQIEAADKAYFAAEAGVEDALYELSAHEAGYETPDLGDSDVRSDDFTQTVTWNNEWEVKNKGLNSCIAFDSWETVTPNYCGRMVRNEKLVLNFFSDNTDAVTGINVNDINTNSPIIINAIDPSGLTITIRPPKSVVDDNNLTSLNIDNDGDFGVSAETGPEGIAGLNEDGHPDFGYGTAICPYSAERAINDDDCDGREDEDSQEDPVILWKLVTDSGRSFQPLRGCKEDAEHFSHTGHPNAMLCEKNFIDQGNDELSITITGSDEGYDSGINDFSTLDAFLVAAATGNNKVQMELLVVAPMETIDLGTLIPIPYYEYGIQFTGGLEDEIPSSYFSIRSDGYYKDFKQSITTNVVPRATTRLLDLTIIQR